MGKLLASLNPTGIFSGARMTLVTSVSLHLHAHTSGQAGVVCVPDPPDSPVTWAGALPGERG